MSTVTRVAIVVASLYIAATAIAQVPEGTRPVAEAWLQEQKADAETYWFSLFRTDAKSFQNATLGQPFKFRWAIHKEFLGYENADPCRILDFASQCDYAYPLMLGTEMLGTIYVREDSSGAGGYTYSGASSGPRSNRVVALQNEYPLKDGYEVSRLGTEGAGAFYVIQHDSVPVYVVPADPEAARAVGLISVGDRPDANATYAVLRFEKAVPGIKAAVAEHRKQVEKGGGGFGIRELPPPDTLR